MIGGMNWGSPRDDEVEVDMEYGEMMGWMLIPQHHIMYRGRLRVDDIDEGEHEYEYQYQY